ncbi:hypothetical protein [Nocardia vinacea]|uniref:hypothetical protein n=1 Tax=Nocardia vinacea TaxID=96468 RepID=UPI001FE1305D|nr:hypothetical protein [Nocardia vinacea]
MAQQMVAVRGSVVLGESGGGVDDVDAHAERSFEHTLEDQMGDHWQDWTEKWRFSQW